MQLKKEVTHIEEERIQVLNNIEELEQKIKDLDNQMEESVREVDSTLQYICTTTERLGTLMVFVLIECQMLNDDFLIICFTNKDRANQQDMFQSLINTMKRLSVKAN